MKINFNNNWTVSDNRGTTKEVTLPYDAMIHENRDILSNNSKHSGYFPGGKYSYQKHFFISEEDKKLSHIIQFEGVYQDAKVWINNHLVTNHLYGYTEFEANISKYIEVGENIIEVIADNSTEPNSRWYTGSGIYRDVWMIKKNENSPTRLKIQTISIDPILIEVESDHMAVIKIYDGEALLYEGESGRISLNKAKLWSLEQPNLYRCVSERGGDFIESNFGIRTIKWNASEGFQLNNHRILLRGGCIHSDNGILGASEYKDAAFRRISILKKAGYNAIRSAHNPISRHLLDACDRLGLLVMDEAYDGWYIPKTYHDYSRIFMNEWKNDLTAMVEKDFNHPSVIMYSIGNEVSETTTKKGICIGDEMVRFIKTMDTTRPVTCGINVLLNVYANLGIGVYKERVDYDRNHKIVNRKYKKKTGSQFFNSIIQLLGPLMFFMAKGKKGDKATKEIADKLDILGLNYGSSRYDEDIKKYPHRMMVGTETMFRDLPYNWERVKNNKQLIGDFVWAAWDYLGEAGVGDWIYNSYEGYPILAGSGGVDITGYIGAEVYYSQVVWGIRKKPYIGVRPVQHQNEVPFKSAWRFTNAIATWNFFGFEGKKAIVEVYSIGKYVDLYLNDKKIGCHKMKKFKTLFKLKYIPGTIKAISYDEKKKKIAEEILTTGKTTHFIAEIDRTKLSVGSNDLCHVDLYFKDENGSIIPHINQDVTIKVNDLELLGFGNACSITNKSYLDCIHSTHNGHALAIIKSGTVRGFHEIRISTEGYPVIIKQIEVI